MGLLCGALQRTAGNFMLKEGSTSFLMLGAQEPFRSHGPAITVPSLPAGKREKRQIAAQPHTEVPNRLRVFDQQAQSFDLSLWICSSLYTGRQVTAGPCRASQAWFIILFIIIGKVRARAFFFFFQVGNLEFVLLVLLSIDAFNMHFPKKDNSKYYRELGA